MNKTFELPIKLEAENYMLTKHSGNIYNVRKEVCDDIGDIIGIIKITPKYVRTTDGRSASYIPYDVDIDIVDSTETLPIDFFKKIILAVAIVS